MHPLLAGGGGEDLEMSACVIDFGHEQSRWKVVRVGCGEWGAHRAFDDRAGSVGSAGNRLGNEMLQLVAHRFPIVGIGQRCLSADDDGPLFR